MSKIENESDLKIYVDVNSGLFKIYGNQEMVEELIQKFEDAGVEMIRLARGGIKSCYKCIFFRKDEVKKCVHPEFADVPLELRDPPKSAVDLDKGCELFLSSARKVIE